MYLCIKCALYILFFVFFSVDTHFMHKLHILAYTKLNKTQNHTKHKITQNILTPHLLYLPHIEYRFCTLSCEDQNVCLNSKFSSLDREIIIYEFSKNRFFKIHISRTVRPTEKISEGIDSSWPRYSKYCTSKKKGDTFFRWAGLSWAGISFAG